MWTVSHDQLFAPTTQFRPDSPPRQLRLALAMRGGVSLAVWIGGAVAEIDTLRRAAAGAPTPEDAAPTDAAPTDAARAVAYRTLLRHTRYDGVTVDVLAGASAGGLNAVVYGYAQSLGLGVDWLEDVWRRSGGLWELVRPTRPLRPPGVPAGQRTFAAPSLLLGDAVFYSAMLAELADKERLADAKKPGGLVADYLTIDLSATRMDSALESTLALGGRRPMLTDAVPNAAGLHVQRRPAALASPFTDLPSPADLAPLDAAALATIGRRATPQDDPAVEEVRFALARLAMAARTTSSFPGAFEPARIRTSAGEHWPMFSPDEIDPARPGLPSMRGVFSRTLAPGTEDRVIDGGVFDNIPISRALEAVQASPAQGPTTRTLLYLDPSPPLSGSLPRTPSAGATGFLEVAVRSIGLKVRDENVDDEVEQLRRHNETEFLARGCQEVLAALLRDLLPLDAAGASGAPAFWDDVTGRFLDWRITVDSQRLGRLLTDPAGTLLRGYVPPTGDRRLTQDAAIRLKDLVPRAYRQTALGPALTRDATSLLGAVTTLISWVQALESLPPTVLEQADAAATSLGALKGELYRLHEVALALRAHGERRTVQLLDEAELAPGAPEQAYVDLLAEAVDAGIVRQGAFECVGPIELGDDAAFWVWAEATLLSATSVPGSLPVLDVAWEAAELARAELVGYGSVDLAWRQTLFALLAAVPLRELDIAAVVRLLGACGGPPGTTSMVAFRRITADQVHEVRRPVLDEDAARSRFLQVLRSGSAEPLLLAEQCQAWLRIDPCCAASKLAGNQLANFAGFLDARWREHDWAWGRADARAALATLLAERAQDTVAQSLAAAEPGGLDADQAAAATAEIEAATAVLLAPTGPDVAKPALADLAPAYRFALVSRLVHGVFRGLWPLDLKTFPNAARAVGLIALRPVLVVAPLVARVEALAVALALLLVAGVPGREQRLGAAGAAVGSGSRIWLAVLLAGLAVGAGVGVGRLFSAVRRWPRVVAAWQAATSAPAAPGAGPNYAAAHVLPKLDAWASRARLRGWLAVSASLLVGVVRSAPRPARPPVEHAARPGLVRAQRVGAAAVVLLAVLAVTPGTTSWLGGFGAWLLRPTSQTLVVAAATAAIAALVHHGWAVCRAAFWAVAAITALAVGLAVGPLHGVDGTAIVALAVGVGCALSTAFVQARTRAPGAVAEPAWIGSGS